MIIDKENNLRNKFFDEKGVKAYIGFINCGEEVIWKEEYVKWLERKYYTLKDTISFVGQSSLFKEGDKWLSDEGVFCEGDDELIEYVENMNKLIKNFNCER